MRRRDFARLGLGVAAALAVETARGPAAAAATLHAGRTHASDIAGPVRFGANYTPSKDWWFLWDNWNAKSVNHDLANIASLGLDHIRIMLPWSMFQPKPHVTDPAKLKLLQQLMSLARDHRLDVAVSVLSAHISGHGFVPKWAVGNYSTVRGIVASEVQLFQAVGQAIGSDSNLIGFDLGNELLGGAPQRDPAIMASWLGQLMSAAKRSAPGKLHTVSPFGAGLPEFPQIDARLGGVTVLHPWWFGPATDGNGNVLPVAAGYPEYQAQHMKAFGAKGRKIWVQEFGTPQFSVSGSVVCPPAQAPDWLEQQFRGLLADPSIYALTWWDSNDVPLKRLSYFNPAERGLGLFDVIGHAKPTAVRLKSLIADYRRTGQLAP